LAGTVCAIPHSVAQAYWLNQFESPIHNQQGQLELAPALQLRGYADKDPRLKQQQALPLELLYWAQRVNRDDQEVAVGQLIVVVFFFAMSSCEYSCVRGKWMTTVAGVDDVQFWANDEIVGADNSEWMRRADAVTVTFRRQKKRDNGVVLVY
jgi:hypothetical protein